MNPLDENNENILTGLLGTINTMMPMIVETLINLLDKLLDGLITIFPKILTTLVDLIMQLLDALWSMFLYLLIKVDMFIGLISFDQIPELEMERLNCGFS